MGEEDEEDDADHLVLAAEIGHRPFADVAGDLLHPLVPLIGGDHLAVEDHRHQQSDDRRQRRHPPDQRHPREHGKGFQFLWNGGFGDGHRFDHHIGGGGQTCE